MAFCRNCGKEMEYDGDFCQYCGTQQSPIRSENNFARRQQEYVGRVRRCPSCGMDLPSLTAVCPGCGHEINDVNVSEALASFVAQLEVSDIKIANCPETPKKGWRTWGIIKKAVWIVLNLCLFCIPLVIYLILKLWNMCRMPTLTVDEKNKASIIENFLFPDNRGVILEVLLFIKAKVVFLADKKADGNYVYWSMLWTKKAEQLYQRAELLFPGDMIAQNTYNEIVSSNELVKKKMRMKILMAGGTVAAVIILIIVGKSVFSLSKKQDILLEWPETGLAQMIPAIESKNGEIIYNDSELFIAYIGGVSNSEYEDYIEDCTEVGFVIESNRKGISYEAFNDEGCRLQLLHTNSDNQLSIQINAAMAMSNLTWPKSEIAKLLPVPESAIGNIEWEADYGFVIYVGDTTIDQYKAYVDACFERGFSEDYQRGEDYFHAKNEDGYKVDLDYRGFNTMFVRIDQPE